MTDPLADDPQTKRVLRYTELSQRDMARVTVGTLKRLNLFEEGMAPRKLTHPEAQQLTDADFEWGR